MRTKHWIATGLCLALAAGGGAWWWSQRASQADVAYRTAKLERGALQATVSASGAVNPVSQVSVSSQISGQIKELFADFNSEVKAGQLIAQIDPATYEYRVRSAEADLDAARASVLTAQANAASTRAAESRAQSDLAEAKRIHERNLRLVSQGFIAQSEADRTRAALVSAEESVKGAQAQQGVTSAQINSAQAAVAQREAMLAQSRVDLGRTRIVSPVSGIVIKRAVEQGQTVAASLQAPEMFVIAQNLSDMQVDASIDEADVGRIRAGQKATFTVDAFPGQTFEGNVRQVRKAAQNVANVVTYIAVVGFQNTTGKLLPGMTANVRVVTDQRDNVLKVPNSALRVRIAGVEPAPPAGSPPPAGTSSQSSGWSWLPEAMAQPMPGGPPGQQSGPPGPGGGFAAQRERLVAELQLTPEQQAKLDDIQTSLRPRFAALRDLPEDQRRGAREPLMADMRSQISAMLTPEQRSRYAQMAQPGAPGAQPNAAAQLKGDESGRPVQPGPKTAETRADKPYPPSGVGQKDSKPTPESAAPMPGNSPATEFRNRLVAELQLSVAQVEKVDAIYAEARPRFMALRDLAQEDRPKARERITADVRARIGDLLTPEQKTKYATLVAESAGRQSTRGRIYLLGSDGKPAAYNVRLGISDGTATELLTSPNAPEAEFLKEGAVVIVGVPSAASPAAKAPTGGPRPPF